MKRAGAPGVKREAVGTTWALRKVLVRARRRPVPSVSREKAAAPPMADME
jgi:hypothetical protein